ncbi:MAG: kelch repeat-containing protein [bacterium]
MAVAALHGEMYVIGGFDDTGRIVPRVSVYDPENDAWRLGAPLPLAMHHGERGGGGGRLWVLGFLRDRLFNEDGRGFVYDPETEVWSEAPAMPDGFHRGAAGVAAIGEVVYVVGGLAAGQATSAVHAFDTVSGAWRRLPDLPGPPRDHMAAGAVDGLLVVAGGRDGRIGAHVARVDVFDPVSETWRRGRICRRRGVGWRRRRGWAAVCDRGEGDPSRVSGCFRRWRCTTWRVIGGGAWGDAGAAAWHRGGGDRGVAVCAGRGGGAGVRGGRGAFAAAGGVSRCAWSGSVRRVAVA